MSQTTFSLQEARNRFSAVVAAALRGAPRVVTRRGVPAVVVVSAADYERLRRLEHASVPSFTELLLEMPQDDQALGRADSTPRAVAF